MTDGVGHPHWGIEFDWLGVDSVGHVGRFSSAGYGEVPVAVMSQADAFDAAYDQLFELAVVGSCGEKPSRAGDYSNWVRTAERGIFGYDWVIWRGPYERLTTPTHPIDIADLPGEFAQLARLVDIPVMFSTATTIELRNCGIDVAGAAPEDRA